MSDDKYASASESSNDDKTLAVSVKLEEPSTLMVLHRHGTRGPCSGPLPLPPPELSPVVVASSDKENHS